MNIRGHILNRASQTKQQMRLHLLAPLVNPQYSAEYTARGVGVGLAIALTPTVGIQIPILVLIWMLINRFQVDKSFNLFAAVTWTWISNIVTLPIIYYVFVVTGRIILGRWDELRGFQVFESRVDSVIVNSEWYRQLLDNMAALLSQFGLPLLIGCIPWALIGGWTGYHWSLKLIERHRAKTL